MLKKTKMRISSNNAGKVTIEDKLPYAVCRKGADSNSLLCQFSRCWVHKRCRGIRGKLKEDGKFKCPACGLFHVK